MANPLSLLFITALVLFWLIPVSAWLMIRNRSNDAIRLWFIATVFGALATTAFVARAVIPEWITNVMTGLCISTMILLMKESLIKEYQSNSKISIKLICSVLGAQLLGNLLLVDAKRYDLLPVLNVSVSVVLDIGLIFVLLKAIKFSKSRSLWVVFFALIFILVTNLFRFIEYSQTGTWPLLLQMSFASNAAFVANFISVVFYTFGYWGLILEKERENVALSKAETIKARLDQQTELNKNLAFVNLLRDRDELIKKLSRLEKFANAGALTASIAHELNQPLTAIQIDAQEALISIKDVRNISQTEKILERIIKNNVRAARVISTVRGVFNKDTNFEEDRNLDQIIDAVISFLHDQITEYSIQISIELNSPTKVLLKTGEIEQVLLNLGLNAIDAVKTSKKRQIHIKSGMLNGSAFIRISDTGPGVSSELADDIFSLFRSNKSKGMGLGLWLSKFILEKNGGSIELAPTSVGSEFIVKVPISA